MTWLNLIDLIKDTIAQTDFNLDVGGALSVGGGQVYPAGGYDFYKWPAASLPLNTSTSPISHSLTITTKGRPVFIGCTGDNNPSDTTSWFYIHFYRNGTLLSTQICESHTNSHNIPFSMIYLDIVEAGTYTYTVEFALGNGPTELNESNNKQSPNFIVFEI